jgi:hypothetical protein
VGLIVFGLQQSALWGWSNPAIWASIAAGVILLVVFFTVEPPAGSATSRAPRPVTTTAR